MNEVRLTQYSHGAGCGCKLSPAVLDQILKNQPAHHEVPELLVGNDARDDAAVIDIGNGECIISTTDFFMPIVIGICVWVALGLRRPAVFRVALGMGVTTSQTGTE